MFTKLKLYILAGIVALGGGGCLHAKDVLFVYGGVSDTTALNSDENRLLAGAVRDAQGALAQSVEQAFRQLTKTAGLNARFAAAEGEFSIQGNRQAEWDRHDVILVFLNNQGTFYFQDGKVLAHSEAQKETTWAFFDLLFVSAKTQTLVHCLPLVVTLGEPLSPHSVPLVVAELGNRLSGENLVSRLRNELSETVFSAKDGKAATYQVSQIAFSEKTKAILGDPDKVGSFVELIATAALARTSRVIPAVSLWENRARSTEVAVRLFNAVPLGKISPIGESLRFEGGVAVYPIKLPPATHPLDLYVKMDQQIISRGELADTLVQAAAIEVWHQGRLFELDEAQAGPLPKNRRGEISSARAYAVLSGALAKMNASTARWQTGAKPEALRQHNPSVMAATPVPALPGDDSSPAQGKLDNEELKRLFGGRTSRIAYALIPIVTEDGKPVDYDRSILVEGLNRALQHHLDDVSVLQGTSPAALNRALAAYNYANWDNHAYTEFTEKVRQLAKDSNAIDFLITGKCLINLSKQRGRDGDLWKASVSIVGTVHDTRKQWDYSQALSGKATFINSDRYELLINAGDETAKALARESVVPRMIRKLLSEGQEGDMLKINLYASDDTFEIGVKKALNRFGRITRDFRSEQGGWEIEYVSKDLDSTVFGSPARLSQKLEITVDCVHNGANLVIAPKSSPPHKAITAALESK